MWNVADGYSWERLPGALFLMVPLGISFEKWPTVRLLPISFQNSREVNKCSSRTWKTFSILTVLQFWIYWDWQESKFRILVQTITKFFLYEKFNG